MHGVRIMLREVDIHGAGFRRGEVVTHGYGIFS